MINNKSTLILICFGITYFVWGATYLFSAIALEQIPAFTLCGWRYLAAGGITLLVSALMAKPKMPSFIELRNATIAGCLFMGLGATGAIWALYYLDTGLTALIIAGEPLVILLMLWLVDKERPPTRAFLGVILGIVGMYLLVSQDNLVSSANQWKGVVIILLSMLAWGSGSIFVSRSPLPKSQLLNSGLQMLVGGLFSIIVSLLIGEEVLAYSDYTNTTIVAVIFLIVFGSVIAFTAFNYLLQNVSTEKVVTNTYVNPIVAMLLGYYFLEELVTGLSIIAAVLMLTGVFFVNTSKGTKKKPQT